MMCLRKRLAVGLYFIKRAVGFLEQDNGMLEDMLVNAGAF